MEPQDYWDREPSEEEGLDVEELRKTIYNEFMEDLAIAAGIASSFPPDWQLQILLNIMKDI
jgi:hypothetical protein